MRETDAKVSVLDVVKTQLSVQKGNQNKVPGAVRESLDMELPHMLGPSQWEQAPFEMALAYAEAASPSAPRQLLELHFAQPLCTEKVHQS